MKKVAVICASAAVFVLTLSLFVFGVVSAFKQSFGVTNTIRFQGVGQNIIFELNAQVTGTNDDEKENHGYHWEYEYDKSNEKARTWEIGEISFNTITEGVADKEIKYSFQIENKGDVRIMAYFTNTYGIDSTFSVSTSSSISSVDGSISNPAYIDSSKTETIWLTIRPTQGQYAGSKDCNFSVMIVSAEE